MNSVRDYHHNAVPDRAIRCVVFDFGGTLSSDPYFKLLGPRVLKQVDRLIFGAENPHLGAGWMTGQLSSGDIAAYLSGQVGLPADVILSSLYEGCAQIGLNEAVWDFAQRQRGLGRKTALVTGNFDVFTDAIVPGRGPDKVFDAIVNSSDYGTGD